MASQTFDKTFCKICCEARNPPIFLRVLPDLARLNALRVELFALRVSFFALRADIFAGRAKLFANRNAREAVRVRPFAVTMGFFDVRVSS